MKNKTAAEAIHILLLAVLAGLAGVAAVIASKFVSLRLIPIIEWPLVFITLAAITSIFMRIRAGRVNTPDALLALLRSLGSDGDVESNKLSRESLSYELLMAEEDLAASIGLLRRDKRRAEMVLSEMADGIIAVDAGGKITLCNRAAEVLLGKKASSLINEAIGAADVHPEIARMSADCVTKGEILTSEIRLPGLPERAISIRAAPFKESDDSVSTLLLLHDLSEIRRHEKTQKEFVSNVSHELRTPITSVRATAEALLAGAKNDEQLVDRFLNTILSESDRLSALIDDLLEIAKRDSGITRTEMSEVNISAIIERAFNRVRPQAMQKGVAVTVDAPERLDSRGDDIQLVQLVQNLIDNAVKYTPSGGTVEISAGKSAGSIIISVRDSGIGIPHGEVDRIFERFYRVDKARSRRLGGTGLGLAIVKDIVEAHGGSIGVETELGKGSLFRVVLPMRSNGPSRLSGIEQ